MDFKNLPPAAQQAILGMMGSAALTPAQKAELSGWMYGGGALADPTLTQGINNILRANNLAPAAGNSAPAPAPTYGPQQAAGPIQAAGPTLPATQPLAATGPGAATAAFAKQATTPPPDPGAGYVDEFGGMLTGQGAGQSQRPTEAGIASQVARETARVAREKAAQQASGPAIPGLPTLGNGAGQKPNLVTETQKGKAPVSATTNNQGGGFLSEVERALAAQDPGYAIAAIRQAKTGGKRDMSAAGDFREGMLGSALRAFLAMQMPNSDGSFVGDPVGAANQGLQDIVHGAMGGGFGGVLRNQASNLLHQDFSGLKDDQIYKMLAAASDAAGFGYGDFAQYGPQNALDEAGNAMRQNVLAGGTSNVLGAPGALTTFQALLNRYLGAK